MSSKTLDKYEYLTGEDLGLKPSTVEQAKFEYCPLGKIFNKGLDKEDKKHGLFKRLENIKDKNEELVNAFNTTNKVSKAPKNKIDNQKKILIYNSQHSFIKLINISEFEELSLDSMHKKLKNFHKKFTDLKNVTPRIGANKNLKEKVLDDAVDLFIDLYYIYKDKYNEEKNNLNTKDKNNFDYERLRLTDNYLYKSEEEQQTSKKEPAVESTKIDVNKFNELITEKEKEINRELFKKHFSLQISSVMLKNLYELNDRKKNNLLVNTIKIGLSDLTNEDETKIEKPYEIVNTVEEVLNIINKEKE